MAIFTSLEAATLLVKNNAGSAKISFDIELR